MYSGSGSSLDSPFEQQPCENKVRTISCQSVELEIQIVFFLNVGFVFFLLLFQAQRYRQSCHFVFSKTDVLVLQVRIWRCSDPEVGPHFSLRFYSETNKFSSLFRRNVGCGSYGLVLVSQHRLGLAKHWNQQTAQSNTLWKGKGGARCCAEALRAPTVSREQHQSFLSVDLTLRNS